MSNTINTFVEELSTKYIDFLKEFIKYYKEHYNNIISINVFLTLPIEFQLNIFYKYIVKEYNTGIYYDDCGIALFYIDVDKAKEVIKINYKNTGKITNIFKQQFNLPEIDMTAAFARAILLAIDVNYLKF